jgi:hypothetical protein
MSTPFIVPLGVRYTLHGTHGGRNIANVLDFGLDLTGSTTPRAQAIDDFSRIIIDQWVLQVLNFLASTYSFNSVSWVDLDSASGSVGSRSVTIANTLPKAGAQLTAAMPGNVAFLIKKALTAQRGARNGRMFLVGVPEVVTDTTAINSVSSGNVTSINTKMAAFLAAVNITMSGTTGFTSKHMVAHVTSRGTPTPPATVGPPLTGILLPVNSLTCDGTLATQRRRLRG